MTTIRVWAPYADRTVEVAAGGTRHPMERGADGWWSGDVPIGPGEDYAFVLDGGEPLPDPRSRHQPAGVHGPSRLLDPSRFAWTDAGWRGRALAGSVVYELHIGTFTAQGTFDAAVERLDALVDLGVDTLELLPVNAFPGRHGWGYDGVGLAAVHEAYGGPAGLVGFVDAAHARGLAVVLDVVFNHLGPDGNYLDRFGPYFTDRHGTPWGPGVNLDGPGSDQVRRFVLDTALGWLSDYHLDGLRIDAVHAIVDLSATHLLEELAVEVEALAAHLGRPLTLIAESDLNDPRVVARREVGGYGLDATWSDDLHHALHAVLTGERGGYYADFGSYADLAAALRRGYVYTGQHSVFRGRRHGREPVGVPAYRFVGYLQNHDQVGNRARGERIGQLVSDGLARVGAALVLTAPSTPMLFMGEEWAASTPWRYFTDHADPALAAAVRDGRRAEFAAFGWAPDDVPDPQDPATLAASRLVWTEREREPHAGMLDWYRRLIRLRRETPELTDPRYAEVTTAYDEPARWFVLGRGDLRTVCNLGPDRQAVPVDGIPVKVLASSAPGFVFREGAVELAGESVAIVRLC